MPDKKGRYLVFSSHIAAASTALMEYLPTCSARAVIMKPLPHMQLMKVTDEEKTRFLATFKYCLAAYCGFCPALCYTVQYDQDQARSIYNRVRFRLRHPPQQEFIREFLNCVLRGGNSNLTKAWDEFTDVEDGVTCKPDVSLSRTPELFPTRRGVAALSPSIENQKRGGQKKNIPRVWGAK